jgi:hypothetical protein
VEESLPACGSTLTLLLAGYAEAWLQGGIGKRLLQATRDAFRHPPALRVEKRALGTRFDGEAFRRPFAAPATGPTQPDLESLGCSSSIVMSHGHCSLGLS